MSESSSSDPQRERRGRSTVTADEILLAAEHVAQDGFDALTMRAVAKHMKASPMALYRYFSTKEQLVDAMLARVLGRISLDPPTDDWLADLAAFAEAHRAVLSAHPWAIVPLFTHSDPGVNATIIGEAAFEILERGGVTGAEAVASLSGVLALNYGWFAFTAARDAARGSSDPEVDLTAAPSMLPAERFPRTLAVAQELGNYRSDLHYRIALQQLVAGIGATGAAEVDFEARQQPDSIGVVRLAERADPC